MFSNKTEIKQFLFLLLTVKITCFLLKMITVNPGLNNRTDFVSFLLNYNQVTNQKCILFRSPSLRNDMFYDIIHLELNRVDLIQLLLLFHAISSSTSHSGQAANTWT